MIRISFGAYLELIKQVQKIKNVCYKDYSLKVTSVVRQKYSVAWGDNLHFEDIFRIMLI